MATAKIMAMIRALNFPALNISLKYTLPDLSAQLYGANRVRDLEARQIQIRIRQPAMGVPTMELGGHE